MEGNRKIESNFSSTKDLKYYLKMTERFVVHPLHKEREGGREGAKEGRRTRRRKVLISILSLSLSLERERESCRMYHSQWPAILPYGKVL